MNEEIIRNAFISLNLDPPSDEQVCIYKSGLIDSAELMQLLLEIEMESGKRLDLAALMEDDISLIRLQEILDKV
jgi:hypothetical protein